MRFIHHQIVSCSFDMIHIQVWIFYQDTIKMSILLKSKSIPSNKILIKDLTDLSRAHHVKVVLKKGKTNHFKNNIFL